TTARIIAAHVGHDDPPRAGVPALPHHLRNHGRIGVGGLFRSAVPTDVGLYQDHIAAPDEAAHTAQFVDRLARQLFGIIALQDRHIRKVWVSGDAVVALHIHRQRWLGPRA